MGVLIGLGQLRSDAGGYLERVVAGETIEVVRRGRLVARIVSVAADRQAPTALPDLVAENGADGRIGLVALRTRAGRYFDRVAAGETISIVWHDKLVARIVSAEPGQGPLARRARNAAAQGLTGPIDLTELRTRPRHYFDRVAAGETIEVARRGKVTARIVSIGGPTQPPRNRLSDDPATTCGHAEESL